MGNVEGDGKMGRSVQITYGTNQRVEHGRMGGGGAGLHK